MFKKAVYGFLLNCLMLSMVYAQEADDILGLWLTEEGEAKVLIYKNKGKYFGKITWLKRVKEHDKIRRDVNNKDAKLRNQALDQIHLIRSLEFKDGKWSGGEVYDPESGETYRCLVKLLDEDRLEVRGYLGLPSFGKSLYWERL
ncbi:DUF2147 domain-containing protein [Echinicola marina]|uniref:DUF2147 domain-containing protein n=1 Tax=Echinicola marina TaxID=2859768 RepID=UPI001CF6E4C0|nr:DUF2147 domain-containing protein [Echinicola marina]UCS92734.1 DUF2147 domain-containing protein [Echinicola marina]